MNMGTIAGGAAGGTALLAALTLLFFLCRRRKRWQTSQSDMVVQVEPYGRSHTVPVVLHSKSMLDIIPASNTPSASASASATSANPVDLPSGQDTQQGQGWTEPPAAPVAAQPVPPQRIPVLHEDGGVRIQWDLLQDINTEDDIPPVYRRYSLED